MSAARLSPRPSHQRADAALVLFAKAPIPGQVKTRLCPPLTPDEAASLHGSFVLDACERSGQAATHGMAKQTRRFDRFMACAPSSEHVFFKVLEERHGVRLIDQIGDDLGARMERTFTDTFRLGYERVVIVGTDLPTLPASVYEDAFGSLSRHDLVLGPSIDGGYYLIGLSRTAPELFREIPWSTPDVLALTQAKAHTLGLTVALLQPQHDVDTIADLCALIDQATLNRAALLTKRTAGAVQFIGEQLKRRGVDRTTPQQRSAAPSARKAP